MDWSFARDDRAIRIVLRLAFRLLDQANTFYQHLFFLGQHLQHFARCSAIVAGYDPDLIPFFDMKFRSVHKTSGASEMIFIKFFSRNSRATGPKIRVPRGFKSLSIMTMALLSKRSSEPSSRRIGCLVRTS